VGLHCFPRLSSIQQVFILKKVLLFVGPDPTGTGTIALDPTFGKSFTLLELVSQGEPIFF
jgi:hypothetical protein